MNEVLRVTHGSAAGRELPLAQELTIGREAPGPGRIAEDSELSRNHARVARSADAVVLEDLGSTNGTYLNGSLVDGEAELHDLDQIRIGDTEFRFELEVG